MTVDLNDIYYRTMTLMIEDKEKPIFAVVSRRYLQYTCVIITVTV